MLFFTEGLFCLCCLQSTERKYEEVMEASKHAKASGTTGADGKSAGIDVDAKQAGGQAGKAAGQAYGQVNSQEALMLAVFTSFENGIGVVSISIMLALLTSFKIVFKLSV